jgi:molybdopterin/thiamine biosynthesis adenylyltransferase
VVKLFFIRIIRGKLFNMTSRNSRKMIYEKIGGVLGGAGNCMTILPGNGPCFRCLVPEVLPAGSCPTCARGEYEILNMSGCKII